MGINVRHEKNDNLVLNQHIIPYIHVARTVPIFINFIYMAFCIKDGVFYTHNTHVIIAKVQTI